MLGEQPDFSSCARRRAMHITFTLLWQAAQLDLTSQRIDDPQHMFESTGRLANVQVNNEVHTLPCRQCQLLLCQRKLLASTTQRSAARGLGGIASGSGSALFRSQLMGATASESTSRLQCCHIRHPY